MCEAVIPLISTGDYDHPAFVRLRFMNKQAEEIQFASLLRSTFKGAIVDDDLLDVTLLGYNKAPVDGSEFPEQWSYSHTKVMRDGRWQVVFTSSFGPQELYGEIHRAQLHGGG